MTAGLTEATGPIKIKSRRRTSAKPDGRKAPRKDGRVQEHASHG